MKNLKMKLVCSIVVMMASLLSGCSNNVLPAKENDNAQVQETQDKENNTEAVEKEMTDDEQSVEEILKEEASANKLLENEWKEAYREVVEKFNSENEDSTYEWSSLGYALIDFDGDEIPELVTGMNGYYVNLYTYHNGEVICIIDDWPYGAGGNAGYEYAEGQGIVSNTNSDYAGLIVYLNYYRLNTDTYELDPAYDKDLCEWNIPDLNGDGQLDWSDAEMAGDDYSKYEPSYRYGDEQISEEEFEAMMIEGDYKELYGEKSYSEIMELLAE